jgi:hypothetical protein
MCNVTTAFIITAFFTIALSVHAGGISVGHVS